MDIQGDLAHWSFFLLEVVGSKYVREHENFHKNYHTCIRKNYKTLMMDNVTSPELKGKC